MMDSSSDLTENNDDSTINVKRLKLEKSEEDLSRSCPYLDTINRCVLDFDFEKLCSVSLSRVNVYACLICGKYFQGRGEKTQAYTHSVAQENHHVFLNLQTKRFYCLPDGYEIIDSSLSDIIYVLNPTFTPHLIKKLESSAKEVRAYGGAMYLPGIVGLNNMKANDFCNVILQALSHVVPVRNYFLEENNYSEIIKRRSTGLLGQKKGKKGGRKNEETNSLDYILVQRFGELIRKLWNPKNFKAHVSPHEMLQAVVLCSKKQFQITEQGDSVAFLSWLLNSLHLALDGTKNPKSSIIYKTFLGGMKIHTRKILPNDASQELANAEEFAWKTTESPFLYLTVELPSMPLFKDDNHENIIPQVSLFNLLSKFNGEREMEYKTYKDNFIKKFEITKLPPYIILYIKRFTKNTFYVEKNHTIVNFPIKSVEFGDLLSPELKEKYPYGGTYDLMANVVHDGDPKDGTYKAHILHKGSGKWFEMQDLHVGQILPEILPLSEAYVQIYERRKNMTPPQPPSSSSNDQS